LVICRTRSRTATSRPRTRRVGERRSGSACCGGEIDWYVGIGEAKVRIWRQGAPKLPKIRVPTRIFWGEEDPLIKEEELTKAPPDRRWWHEANLY
jgi:pimeloyl-ACP methyl ester carboxylesterase